MSKRLFHRTIAGTLAAGLIAAGGISAGAGTASAAPSVNTIPVHVQVDSKVITNLSNQGSSLEDLLKSNPQLSQLFNNGSLPGFSFNLQDIFKNFPSAGSPGEVTAPPAGSGSNNGSTPTAPSKPGTTTPDKPDSSNGSNGGTATEQSKFEAEVVRLVNVERGKAGLKPLASDSALARVALDKAKDMYNNHYFSHTSPTYGSPFDMMTQYGIKYSYAGENIASGQQSPAQVMNDWMNSQGHRENILNANFNKIGVGYYNGQWVQEFTN
ncbi:CAP domain-containing protein [Paenibacillus pinihumi]|uniref:CAP domain-containing protein n=1 Tax=Paenibacillus pinihumi TaxID=669462 RepID=UPI0004010FFF|nr:CAP domain-containing protein [Paenibacillus pinihumi]